MMRTFSTSLFLLQLLFFSYEALAQELSSSILINEFMSSNSNTIADEEGDFSDWIELYNPTQETVNLKGWGLSDNISNPFKWVFPEVTIGPGDYLLVWASGKNRATSQKGLSQGVQQDVYLNIPGTKVSDLTDNHNYPENPSSTTIYTDFFEASIDIDDNYGQRMHGLLKAPETGYYTFWISSDDEGMLFLSSDDKSFNLQQIAEVPGWAKTRIWDKYSQQKSEKIYLTAGQYYYISALMKEGTGNDHLAVGWEKPNGSIERPMSASHIFIAPRDLHTNFSISSDGEPLLLTDSFGETVHFISEVKLTNDISYGLLEGQTGFWYFDHPTPSAKNDTLGYNEILESVVEFSHKGGFYNDSFELVLSSVAPDVLLYYTLDGSEPSPSNLDGTDYIYKKDYLSDSFLTRKTRTHLYNGPISIVDRSPNPYELGTINTRYHSRVWLPLDNYFKGTVVRVKAIKRGAITPYSSTQTYFVDPQGGSKYDLPVVSIATDESNLFDYIKGIYVAGKIADDWVASHPDEEWHGLRPANYNQHGSEWEKPAHLEYFGDGGTSSYTHYIGIRTHGAWSRSLYRKSLRLYARGGYGTGDRLDYPFFGDLRAKGNSNLRVNDFRRVMLRNSGNDFDATLYRDALMHDLVKHLPFTTMASQPIVHFINGEYWGIMNLRERYDKYYLESHFGVSPEDVTILDFRGDIEEGYLDDRSHFFETLSYVEENDPFIQKNYEWIKERIDVESLAQYYAAQIYFYNTDWPHNNMTFWRNRAGRYGVNTPQGLDGRWSWMLYDTDYGLIKYDLNALSRLMESRTNDPSSRIFKRLLLNVEFRNQFINIVLDQLNSCFKPDYISSKVDEFNAKIAGSRLEHFNRWKSGDDEGSSMKTFGRERPQYVLADMRAQFWLPDNEKLIVSTQGGGSIKVNSLLINSQLPGLLNPASPYPWEGTYFKQIPIKLQAIDEEGYRFSHWDGVDHMIKEDKEIEVFLTKAQSITAVFSEAKTYLIHYWHFNNLDKGELDKLKADQSLLKKPGVIYYPGTGQGYMDQVGEGSKLNTRNNTDSGEALRVRNPSDTRYLELHLPTTGFENIKVSYAATRTRNGASKQEIFYRSKENGPWISFRESRSITEAYQHINLDFSHLPEVNNNEHFAIRISFTGSAASGTSGNNRFDNIVVEGYSIGVEFDEPDTRFALTISPNPSSDVVHIVSAYRLKLIELSDMNGRRIKLESADDYTHTLNVSDLTKGLYLLSVSSERGAEHIKLVVK